MYIPINTYYIYVTIRYIKLNLFKFTTVRFINLTWCLATNNVLIRSFQSILSWLAVFIKIINFLRGPNKIAM